MWYLLHTLIITNSPASFYPPLMTHFKLSESQYKVCQRIHDVVLDMLQTTQSGNRWMTQLQEKMSYSTVSLITLSTALQQSALITGQETPSSLLQNGSFVFYFASLRFCWNIENDGISPLCHMVQSDLNWWHHCEHQSVNTSVNKLLSSRISLKVWKTQ